MKIQLFPVPVMALLLALASGCATASKPENYPPSEPIALNQTDNGKTIAAVPGQEIRVTLGSNPSTGYRWNGPEIVRPASLRFVSTRYVAPAEVRPGAGGTEEIIFRALAPGSSTVTLTYARPFAPQDGPSRFTFTVNVAAPAK